MTRTVKCLNEAFEPSSECIGDRPSDLENCNPQECVDNAPPTSKYQHKQDISNITLYLFASLSKHSKAKIMNISVCILAILNSSTALCI